MLGVTHLTSGSQVVPPPPQCFHMCVSQRSHRRLKLRHVRRQNIEEMKAEQLQHTRATWLPPLGRLDSTSTWTLPPPPTPRGSFVKRRHSFNKANKQEAWEKIMQPFLFKLNRRSSLLLSPRQIISIFFIFRDHTHSFINIIGGKKAPPQWLLVRVQSLYQC